MRIDFDGPNATQLKTCLALRARLGRTWEELTALAEQAGIERIAVSDFPPDGDLDNLAGLYLPRNGKPWIVLNAAAFDPTQTLAHELGHHYLHRGLDNALYWSDDTYHRQIEDEADAWALEVLQGIWRRLDAEADAWARQLIEESRR